MTIVCCAWGLAPVAELDGPRSEVRAHSPGKVPHGRFDCGFGHAPVTDHESTAVRRYDSKRRESSDPDTGASRVQRDRAVIDPRGRSQQEVQAGGDSLHLELR